MEAHLGTLLFGITAFILCLFAAIPLGVRFINWFNQFLPDPFKISLEPAETVRKAGEKPRRHILPYSLSWTHGRYRRIYHPGVLPDYKEGNEAMRMEHQKQEQSGTWMQVDIATTTEGIEPVAALLLQMNLGYSVTDAADFEEFLEGKSGHWDYIDDEVMKLRDAPTVVAAYLADGEQGKAQLDTLRDGLERLRGLDEANQWGPLTFELSSVKEEDWATSWKQYYHPVKIGERLVICPTWEEYEPSEDEVVVRMDPGMAFGTGTHESTKLCLELLQDIADTGKRVLDVGCGSGILAISAVKLGAYDALGVDIDQVSVEVARGNAAENGLEKQVTFRQGSLADGVTGRYDIVFANIVADIILRLLPDISRLLAPGGSLIASGIIDERFEDVADGVREAGLRVVERRDDNGWVALRIVCD
ncbi:MAG: 50S ribosomal protein L11 methyltransferase [Oscillospiraceae bacterium]